MERPVRAAEHHAAHAVPAGCAAAHIRAQALVEGQARCCAHLPTEAPSMVMSVSILPLHVVF